MNRINYQPLMTNYFVENKVFENFPFSLIDIGASGGIDDYWKAFKSSLQAIGFEPLIHECARLNVKDADWNIKYLPFFIVSGESALDSPENNQFSSRYFSRTSAVFATELLQMNYIQEKFNAGEKPTYTESKVTLDYFLSQNARDVDFIKIDTDGFDYQVLYGASKTLDDRNVLGLLVECQFHGECHANSNVFRNIDRLLNEKGFTLFDLSTYRYTKRDLPGKFLCSIPAQSETGQVLWGDALYLRDLSDPKNLSFTKNLSDLKLLKLAAVHEIFGLYDCAVELLKTYRQRLSALIDIDSCLDFLTKQMGFFSSYHEHQKCFEKDPTFFYPKFTEKFTAAQARESNLLKFIVRKIKSKIFLQK